MGLERYAQEDREALCQHNEERYDWLEDNGVQQFVAEFLLMAVLRVTYFCQKLSGLTNSV